MLNLNAFHFIREAAKKLSFITNVICVQHAVVYVELIVWMAHVVIGLNKSDSAEKLLDLLASVEASDLRI